MRPPMSRAQLGAWFWVGTTLGYCAVLAAVAERSGCRAPLAAEVDEVARYARSASLGTASEKVLVGAPSVAKSEFCLTRADTGY